MWRSKKMSQEAGRLTQVCVWAPEQDAEFVRQLCTRVAEPTERGSTLRSVLRKQLNRRRTTYAEWSGINWKAEIDCPFIGPWWFMRHIGGRVIGPYGTHIELSPQEAETLMVRLRRTCEKEIESWTREQKLAGVLRDDTGVIVTPQQYRLSGERTPHPFVQLMTLNFPPTKLRFPALSSKPLSPTASHLSRTLQSSSTKVSMASQAFARSFTDRIRDASSLRSFTCPTVARARPTWPLR